MSRVKGVRQRDIMEDQKRSKGGDFGGYEVCAMKIYMIYDMQTDEIIGAVEAENILDAERKASEKFNIASDQLYALRED